MGGALLQERWRLQGEAGSVRKEEEEEKEEEQQEEQEEQEEEEEEKEEEQEEEEEEEEEQEEEGGGAGGGGGGGGERRRRRKSSRWSSMRSSRRSRTSSRSSRRRSRKRRSLTPLWTALTGWPLCCSENPAKQSMLLRMLGRLLWMSVSRMGIRRNSSSLACWESGGVARRQSSGPLGLKKPPKQTTKSVETRSGSEHPGQNFTHVDSAVGLSIEGDGAGADVQLGGGAKRLLSSCRNTWMSFREERRTLTSTEFLWPHPHQCSSACFSPARWSNAHRRGRSMVEGGGAMFDLQEQKVSERRSQELLLLSQTPSLGGDARHKKSDCENRRGMQGVAPGGRPAALRGPLFSELRHSWFAIIQSLWPPLRRNLNFCSPAAALLRGRGFSSSVSPPPDSAADTQKLTQEPEHGVPPETIRGWSHRRADPRLLLMWAELTPINMALPLPVTSEILLQSVGGAYCCSSVTCRRSMGTS
ncbi:hypothetical protein FQA47_004143 [Oryzias melastigma]|uniref:Uncharacterized protein n=1 Tax=Oryzias melastigma TaxID=30732 RepID=A0A834CQ58_ORYME|nr:hypothetical protein FQA47_004143 [Oryzias melastigma]